MPPPYTLTAAADVQHTAAADDTPVSLMRTPPPLPFCWSPYVPSLAASALLGFDGQEEKPLFGVENQEVNPCVRTLIGRRDKPERRRQKKNRGIKLKNIL
jgi:hypothetical protein